MGQKDKKKRKEYKYTRKMQTKERRAILILDKIEINAETLNDALTVAKRYNLLEGICSMNIFILKHKY